ncbi:MAG: hypothetical protein FJ008_05000 [Chloroflexi bacterium]|nr:hypothetical protein [Chloroflexota bacterium]MBM3154674.1 hypothetical protein [Chloroflexota bacterium]MBM3172722.1 hypothetical protein [Chloroflexota bacterium]MBM3175575.1 hypothetical protein [Chloroflexota bacterium]MBM4451693.1 hypothetical protein [Chloroflexota bacterium]
MALVYKSKLRVNKTSVELNAFVDDFLGRTCEGIVSSLRGVDKVQKLTIRKDKDEIKITVNGKEIPLTPFPNDIIRNTLTALVSSLKDVERVDSFDIEVEVK